MARPRGHDMPRASSRSGMDRLRHTCAVSPLFRRSKGEEPAEPAREYTDPAEVPAADASLAATIARHFDGGCTSGRTAFLGFNDVSIECYVAGTSPVGANRSASLFLLLRGGRLGAQPVFASISGYGTSDEEAIVAGGCEWSCQFGPVLRAALADSVEPDIEPLHTTVDGRSYRVAAAGLGRLLGSVPEQEPGELLRTVHRHLAGEALLTQVVLDSDTLPVLPAHTSTLLSVFVMEGPNSRVVEVKVNGVDWPPASLAFPQPALPLSSVMALERELAVLTPDEELQLPTRAALDRTLAGLALRTDPEQPAGWRGWRAHRGVLGPCMTEHQVTALQKIIGPLGADHATFLTTIASSGAGPGYGLLPPHPVGELLPLAHAGCGVTWVLRLDAEHRGEVWVDAAGSDGTYTPVASSFLTWYLAWIESAVRADTPWTSWDTACCATPHVLSRFLDANPGTTTLSGRLDQHAIKLTGGGVYLPADSPLDPCHGCTALAARLGLTDQVFAPGILCTG